MSCIPVFRLSLLVCILLQSIFAFWIPIHPPPVARPLALPSPWSLSLSARPDEEEFLAKKRAQEEKQKEWERKIQAKNEQKALGKSPGTPAKQTSSTGKPKSQTGNEEADSAKDADDDDDASTCTHYVSKDAVTFAQAHAAELIALEGPKFDGDLLGVGGLDDVIAELKRRVWTPLAAPPSVMAELGISPVRGVLLYGSSGCGKTLLARTIGKLLSPARPLTVVSGPQLMDKFVGSSEKNLRDLFDNPSGVYDPYRISGGKGMDTAALHVIVLDEFDAMARTRGGPDSANTAAGVARDSVVNQILSKMDGVDPLAVPTLVIAMTNRPNLIDPALLRPGRFEVQIEVPPPRTAADRKSVLNVHMSKMQTAGRLAVQDAPKDGYVSLECAQESGRTYDELLSYLAEACEGFSGASLAAVPRAAASRALERAVSQYSVDLNESRQQPATVKNDKNSDNTNQGRQDAIAMFDCVVTLEDLECAVQDVRKSAATTSLEQSTTLDEKQQASSQSNAAKATTTLNGSIEIEEFVNSGAS